MTARGKVASGKLEQTTVAGFARGSATRESANAEGPATVERLATIGGLVADGGATAGSATVEELATSGGSATVKGSATARGSADVGGSPAGESATAKRSATVGGSASVGGSPAGGSAAVEGLSIVEASAAVGGSPAGASATAELSATVGPAATFGDAASHSKHKVSHATASGLPGQEQVVMDVAPQPQTSRRPATSPTLPTAAGAEAGLEAAERSDTCCGNQETCQTGCTVVNAAALPKILAASSHSSQADQAASSLHVVDEPQSLKQV